MKRLSLALIIIVTFCLSMKTVNANGYRTFETPQATTTEEGKIEVVELFWYMCPHCYEFEHHLQEWTKTLADDVEFKRMPAIFNARWMFHAHVFYTAEELGVLDKIHTPLFEAIHKHGQKLHTKMHMQDFFFQHGINDDDFDKAWESDAVKKKIEHAHKMIRQYKATGVPALIINGKYLTGVDKELAGSFENMLEIADKLIEKERQLQ